MKESRKQIYNQAVNDISKRYKAEVERYKDIAEKRWRSYIQECDKSQKLYNENEELKEKVQQYEDWIRRLQEFMDMPEDLRKAELKKMQQEQKFQEYVADSEFFSMIKLFSRGLF